MFIRQHLTNCFNSGMMTPFPGYDISTPTTSKGHLLTTAKLKSTAGAGCWILDVKRWHSA